MHDKLANYRGFTRAAEILDRENTLALQIGYPADEPNQLRVILLMKTGQQLLGVAIVDPDDLQIWVCDNWAELVGTEASRVAGATCEALDAESKLHKAEPAPRINIRGVAERRATEQLTNDLWADYNASLDQGPKSE